MSAGHASSKKDQQFEPWVLELAAKRAEAQQAAESSAEARTEPEISARVERTRTEPLVQPKKAKRQGAVTQRPAITPLAANQPEPVTDLEKIREGIRLYKEVGEMAQELEELNNNDNSTISDKRRQLREDRQRFNR